MIDLSVRKWAKIHVEGQKDPVVPDVTAALGHELVHAWQNALGIAPAVYGSTMSGNIIAWTAHGGADPDHIEATVVGTEDLRKVLPDLKCKCVYTENMIREALKRPKRILKAKHPVGEIQIDPWQVRERWRP